ncbi:hypothetical protein BS46_gp59 [Acinetobacter phage BS46]|nr:hypothetical protein BS46_gp59 [Acinetobacter phage BS46]
MTTNFSILIIDGLAIESVYVRELTSESEYDLSDVDQVVDFVAYFLGLENSTLIIEKYSRFARYASINYEDTYGVKEIILTWENFQ